MVLSRVVGGTVGVQIRWGVYSTVIRFDHETKVGEVGPNILHPAGSVSSASAPSMSVRCAK